MTSSQAYVGTAKRTFNQAIVHLLETNYRLLGSRRVLELIAADIEALVDQFHPVPKRLRSGWMVFTGEKTRQALLQKRLARIVEYGWQHPAGPVVLTLADLASMLNMSTVEISQLLKAARKATGKPLLTKGHYFDQGMRPTHKHQIIALYEAGLDEIDIARQSQHHQDSVGKYIRDYERVKLLLKKGISPKRIEYITQLQPSVVKAYIAMVNEQHPDLMPEPMSPAQA
jgi:hypothetical protein